MKPGDLVKQAPNVFSDRKVAGKKMLVLKVIDGGPHRGDSVITLLEGEERVWHYTELEVFSETR
mgnify:CR=1 FL=1